MNSWTLSKYLLILMAVSDALMVIAQEDVLDPKLDENGRPPCASSPDATFCEKVDDYPEAEIRKAIPYSPEEFKKLFGTSEITPRVTYTSVTTDENICDEKTESFYPRIALNQEGKWIYLVNDEEYKQAVVSETCVNEGKPCKFLDGALSGGMSSICKQKYALKRMVAVKRNQEDPHFIDFFKFPSCCVCQVLKS